MTVETLTSVNTLTDTDTFIMDDYLNFDDAYVPEPQVKREDSFYSQSAPTTFNPMFDFQPVPPPPTDPASAFLNPAPTQPTTTANPPPTAANYNPVAAAAEGPITTDVFQLDSPSGGLFGDLATNDMLDIVDSDGMGQAQWQQNAQVWTGGTQAQQQQQQLLTVSPFQVGGWWPKQEEEGTWNPGFPPNNGTASTSRIADTLDGENLFAQDDKELFQMDEEMAESTNGSDSDAMSVSSIPDLPPIGLSISQRRRASAPRIMLKPPHQSSHQSGLSGRRKSMPLTMSDDLVYPWRDTTMDEKDDLFGGVDLAPRRQTKQKVTPRMSRLRRKDQYSSMEEELKCHRSENVHLRQRLAEYEKETKALRKEVVTLKKQLGTGGSVGKEGGAGVGGLGGGKAGVSSGSGDLRAAVQQRKENLNDLLKRLTVPTTASVNIAFAPPHPTRTSPLLQTQSNLPFSVQNTLPFTLDASTPTPATPSSPSITPFTPTSATSITPSPAPTPIPQPHLQQQQQLAKPTKLPSSPITAAFCHPTTQGGASGWAQNRVKVHSVFVESPSIGAIPSAKAAPEKKATMVTLDAGKGRKVNLDLTGLPSNSMISPALGSPAPLNAKTLISLAGLIGTHATSAPMSAPVEKKKEVMGKGKSLVERAMSRAWEGMKLRDVGGFSHKRDEEVEEEVETEAGKKEAEVDVLTKILLIILLSLEGGR
ncbi:hypothetical protein HK097_007741 [Rhizophlyctis rosea]|uniref:BZIP domain-containing protein n=1 Tax=Rhizophlyctis rosea TaxID=64517 RepID=A0AAD5X511_9FUNG|nr:hypothetical protein HK097_007741 [Rhizophlyctis rosea]